MSRLPESGVLIKRDMQNMQSGGGGARTVIKNRCATLLQSVISSVLSHEKI